MDNLRREWFMRLMCGGKRLPARLMDHAFFLLLTYLVLVFLFIAHPARLLLAAILTVSAGAARMLFLRVRYKRFSRRQMEQIRSQLFRQELLLLSPSELRQVLTAAVDVPFSVICRFSTVTVDELLTVLHNEPHAKMCFVTSALTADARTFSERHMKHIRIVEPDKLYEMQNGSTRISDAQVYAHIDSMQAASRKRDKVPILPKGTTAAGKYLVIGVLLLALSFIMRYALYGRLLSGLAFLMAGFVGFPALFDRSQKNTAPP